MKYIDVLKKHELIKKDEILLWLFRRVSSEVSKEVAQYMLVEDRTVFNSRAAMLMAGITEILSRHFEGPLVKILEAAKTSKSDAENNNWEVSLVMENMATFKYMRIKGLGRLLDHIIKSYQAKNKATLIKVEVKPTNKEISK